MTKLPLIPLAFFFASPSLASGQEVTTNGAFTAGATFNIPRSGPAPVTGAPYCADQISETQQTLNDGTHISQTNRDSHVCRDSAGRVREERFLFGPRRPSAPANNITVVDIRDPVAGVQYTLDTQHKIAHRASVPAESPNSARLARGATAPMARRTTTPVNPINPTPSSSAADSSAKPELSTESLGTQTFSGVQAQGTLFKTVYPVNFEGNDRPITVTRETWMSPDLKIVVMSKNSDPRHGDRINRLDNLTTGEPDPSLFQAPPDYQVVDETGPFKINFSRQ